MRYERDVLLKDLKENVIEVTFTKVNGEQRVMRCTLKQEHLPPNTDIGYLEEEHKREQNINTIACWDVHKGGWRSFRIENVIYVQIMDGY
jgi:hypothetical protein